MVILPPAAHCRREAVAQLLGVVADPATRHCDLLNGGDGDPAAGRTAGVRVWRNFLAW